MLKKNTLNISKWEYKNGSAHTNEIIIIIIVGKRTQQRNKITVCIDSHGKIKSDVTRPAANSLYKNTTKYVIEQINEWMNE